MTICIENKCTLIHDCVFLTRGARTSKNFTLKTYKLRIIIITQ